jgi:hypothetical protein
VRAEQDGSTENLREPPSGDVPIAAPEGTSDLHAAQSQGLQSGQSTAIVTGAISVFLGLAYIAITVALDSRGGELLPPPPEAFQ